MRHDTTVRLIITAHFIHRCREQGIPWTPRDITRLEGLLERASPLLQPDAAGRASIVLRVDGRRLRVIYDTRYRALVTVWKLAPMRDRDPSRPLRGRRGRSDRHWCRGPIPGGLWADVNAYDGRGRD